jgi:hypothetical protein
MFCIAFGRYLRSTMLVTKEPNGVRRHSGNVENKAGKKMRVLRHNDAPRRYCRACAVVFVP